MQYDDAPPIIDFDAHFLLKEVFDQCHSHSLAREFELARRV